MPLNTQTLAGEIKTAIEQSNGSITPVSDPLNNQSDAEAQGGEYLESMSKAIAKAVVEHIQNNLLVKSLGTGYSGTPVNSNSTTVS